nr:MAG TPA: hypothetical protein [Caudoviricetes sp.]
MAESIRPHAIPKGRVNKTEGVKVWLGCTLKT